MVIIGIDPDLSKSGVASIVDGRHITYEGLGFVELTERIRSDAKNIKRVYLEAGWLNKKSNWHGGSSLGVASRIGKNVGENHATGKLLAQVINALGVDVVLVKPSTKKLNAEQFKKTTGINGKSNQDQRDAVMLVWGRTC